MRQADRVESPRRGEPPRWRGKRSTIPLLVVGSIVAVGALVRAQLLDQVIRRDEAQTYLQFAGSFTAARKLGEPLLPRPAWNWVMRSFEFVYPHR